MAPALDQPRLALVQLWVEALKTHAQIDLEPLCVTHDARNRHGVVGAADDDHIAARVPTPPLVDPWVEDVVQVDVRQERRN
ncbi:MAG TPA: hypothetical protein VNY35_05205 [Solirubrobacteraceae bacterium]|nr:hypothetical protein [Solirubrobacteraceae bacterium]